MTYVPLSGEYYENTKTFVVDRSELFDEFQLSFNPSEYVEAYFKGLTCLFKRVDILYDTLGNIVYWQYLSDGLTVKHLFVFNL